jgi:hypothetical protein
VASSYLRCLLKGRRRVVRDKDRSRVEVGSSGCGLVLEGVNVTRGTKADGARMTSLTRGRAVSWLGDRQSMTPPSRVDPACPAASTASKGLGQ